MVTSELLLSPILLKELHVCHSLDPLILANISCGSLVTVAGKV